MTLIGLIFTDELKAKAGNRKKSKGRSNTKSKTFWPQICADKRRKNTRGKKSKSKTLPVMTLIGLIFTDELKSRGLGEREKIKIKNRSKSKTF